METRRSSDGRTHRDLTYGTGLSDNCLDSTFLVTNSCRCCHRLHSCLVVTKKIGRSLSQPQLSTIAKRSFMSHLYDGAIAVS